MRPVPFPFLRHGPSKTKGLRLWLALATPSADPAPLVAGLRRLISGVAVRHQGGALEVTARPFRLPLAALDDGLRALHAETPLALAVRLERVTASEWHTASLADVARILDALERLVRAHRGPYVSDDSPIDQSRGDDVAALVVDALAGCAPVAELVDATVRCLLESAPGKARLVLADQLLERLGGFLGVSFEVDAVLRLHLASLQGLSPGSVAMPAAFTNAFAERVRSSHREQSRPWRRSAGPFDWSKLDVVRRAMARKQLSQLAGALNESEEAHVATLLALEPGERLALAENDTLALRMANAASMLMPLGRFADALALYDAALAASLPSLACANPLYAVQNDNNHLGVDAVRARRYLERCLPRGGENPTIFLNASFVWMELGEPERALEALAKAKELGVAVKGHRNEPLFAPLRDRPAFKALMR